MKLKIHKLRGKVKKKKHTKKSPTKEIKKNCEGQEHNGECAERNNQKTTKQNTIQNTAEMHFQT